MILVTLNLLTMINFSLTLIIIVIVILILFILALVRSNWILSINLVLLADYVVSTLNLKVRLALIYVFSFIF
jgi:hypothetical protein